MNLLLDTNVLLFWIANDPRIGSAMSEAIKSEKNTIFFSPLSIWEARIKAAKGRLTLPSQFLEVVRSKDFTELRFTAEHADEAGKLPSIHWDPFDRGLIAQARLERMTMLTSDRLLSRYDVRLQLV